MIRMSSAENLLHFAWSNPSVGELRDLQKQELSLKPKSMTRYDRLGLARFRSGSPTFAFENSLETHVASRPDSYKWLETVRGRAFGIRGVNSLRCLMGRQQIDPKQVVDPKQLDMNLREYKYEWYPVFDEYTVSGMFLACAGAFIFSAVSALVIIANFGSASVMPSGILVGAMSLIVPGLVLRNRLRSIKREKLVDARDMIMAHFDRADKTAYFDGRDNELKDYITGGYSRFLKSRYQELLRIRGRLEEDRKACFSAYDLPYGGSRVIYQEDILPGVDRNLERINSVIEEVESLLAQTKQHLEAIPAILKQLENEQT